MKVILGKKLGMSQVFDDKGKVTPVTLIEAGPCSVVQIKTTDKDGYDAIQLGYGRKQNVSKPVRGHLKKAKADESTRYLREFRTDKVEVKIGDTVKADTFVVGDPITVVAISKGKGFQGPVKRHNFKGGGKSHGHRHDVRARGSIGQRFPQHTLKGTKMAGRMGNNRVTVSGLRIIKIDAGKNILAVKGAVPGTVNGLVAIESK